MDEIFSFMNQTIQENFGVRVRLEANAALFQTLPQFSEVVYAPIEHQYKSTIRRRHGLRCSFAHIDYGKSLMRKVHRAFSPDPTSIWTSVGNPGCHLRQLILGDRVIGLIEYA
jgi:hypothetical protein